MRRSCPGHSAPFPVHLSTVRTFASKGVSACKECRKRAKENERRADMIRLGVLPMEVITEVRQEVRGWCLRCGSVVQPRLDNLRSGQGGCRNCGGKARLSDADARERARVWGYEPYPDIPYTNDATKWPGRCLAAGHHTEPVLNSYRRSGPCQECASHGFKPDQPALLYLVVSGRLNAAKVGICGADNRNTRLADHRRAGWTLVHSRMFDEGRFARLIERSVVRLWRERDDGPVLDTGARYVGYTETVSLAARSVDALWADVETEISRMMPGVRTSTFRQ